MSVLDQFITFAKALPADQRPPLDEALGAIMATYSDIYGFTGKELSELDRRITTRRSD